MKKEKSSEFSKVMKTRTLQTILVCLLVCSLPTIPVTLASSPTNDKAPTQKLIEFIAELTTSVSLICISLAGLSWALGSALLATPISIKELRSESQSLIINSIKSLFMLSIWSAVSVLISWLAAALCAIV